MLIMHVSIRTQLYSIDAHPTVPFWTIINPASGPGQANTQPGPEYQRCLPQLLSKPNVVVLGYVATTRGASSEQGRVIRDVDTYAGWAAGYKVDGIFFDEVSGQSADFATYQNFTSHAKTTFGFVSMILIVYSPLLASCCLYSACSYTMC